LLLNLYGKGTIDAYAASRVVVIYVVICHNDDIGKFSHKERKLLKGIEMSDINSLEVKNLVGVVYKRTELKYNTARLYQGNCISCGKILLLRKWNVKRSKGKCLFCPNEGNQIPKEEKLRRGREKEKKKRERLQKRRDNYEANRMKEGKKVKSDIFLLGDLINEFDSLEDNSISMFNSLFEENIGGDLTRTVEILTPYTHNGRMLSIDNGIPFQFLFKDDLSDCTDDIAYDIYSKGNEFVQRYRKLVTIARDFQTDTSIVLSWFDNSYDNKHKIRVEKVRLSTGKRIALRKK
jgi:hypothetical protein